MALSLVTSARPGKRHWVSGRMDLYGVTGGGPARPVWTGTQVVAARRTRRRARPPNGPRERVRGPFGRADQEVLGIVWTGAKPSVVPKFVNQVEGKIDTGVWTPGR